MSYTYEYPRPAVTADAAVFASENGVIKVLLIQRGREPYLHKWALPGGFVDMDEDLDDAVAREVEEETGLKLTGFAQLKTFGKPGRDPRHRTITIAYFKIIDKIMPVTGQDDAMNAGWFDVDDLPGLAFDHDEIIRCAREKLQF